MFGVDSTEFAILAILALIFIGPKELPGAMRTLGHWIGQIRGMARHFTSGIKEMVREAELEEMEKKWREENERIMALHPPDAHYPEPGRSDRTDQPDEQQVMLPLAPPESEPPVDDDPRPPSERPLP